MTTALTAHRFEGVIDPDGKLTLSDLPLRPGEKVEVIVLSLESIQKQPGTTVFQKLQGSILKDEDPFGPAASPDDWEAAK